MTNRVPQHLQQMQHDKSAASLSSHRNQDKMLLQPTQKNMCSVLKQRGFFPACYWEAQREVSHRCRPTFDLPLYVNPPDPTLSLTNKAYWQKPTMTPCPGFPNGQCGRSDGCKPNQKPKKPTLFKVKVQGNKKCYFQIKYDEKNSY